MAPKPLYPLLVSNPWLRDYKKSRFLKVFYKKCLRSVTQLIMNRIALADKAMGVINRVIKWKFLNKPTKKFISETCFFIRRQYPKCVQTLYLPLKACDNFFYNFIGFLCSLYISMNTKTLAFKSLRKTLVNLDTFLREKKRVSKKFSRCVMHLIKRASQINKAMKKNNYFFIINIAKVFKAFGIALKLSQNKRNIFEKKALSFIIN